MPTEELYIADSQDVAQNGGYEGARVREDFSGATQVDILRGIRDALLAAGWVDSGTTKAQWSLVLPYGLPWTTPPDLEVEDPPTVTTGPNPVTVDGMRIMFYDPFRTLPIDQPDVHWIPMGVTHEDSIGNLAAAVEEYSWNYLGFHFDTAYPFFGWLHLDFEAVTGGIERNGAWAGGDGDVSSSISGIWFWAFLSAVGQIGGPFGNAPAGGGIYLRSYQSETDYLQVWLGIPESGSPAASLQFSTSIEGGGQPIYQLGAADGWAFRIIANQFQFFCWQTAGGTGGQVFASFPRLARFRGVDYAAVVGKNFRDVLQWSDAYSAANGPLIRSQGWMDSGRVDARQPGLYCFKVHGVAYRNVDGKAIAQTAYLGTMATEADDARIVAVLWDAFLAQGLFPLGDEVMQDGRAYECIARQDGGAYAAHATLWVGY